MTAPAFLDVRSYSVDEIAGSGGVARRPAGLPTVRANQPAALIQSSGTTGEPKRLFLTHRQLIERNRRRIAMHDLGPADRFLQVPSLRFSWGRDGTIVVLMAGGTVVLNHARSADDYLQYFGPGGVTYVTLTPFHLRQLFARASGDGPLWPHLKMVVASAPVTPDERLRARRQLTPRFVELYGANEVSTLTLAYLDDQERQPESIGRLIEGVEAQVVGDDEKPLPFGEVGEIGFRGPGYFPAAYFKNPGATARHFRSGWYYPGDLAVLNREGYVFLRGRADDVINNAGTKYFPSEVEIVLSRHPAVAEVAVIGGPHPELGEVSVAYVVRSAPVTADELFQFCHGKIAMYKAPRWVFFLGAIPRVPAGKPDKKALRETFRRYLDSRGRGEPVPGTAN